MIDNSLKWQKQRSLKLSRTLPTEQFTYKCLWLILCMPTKKKPETVIVPTMTELSIKTTEITSVVDAYKM